MVAPYVGAGKDYVAAPLFLLFGARVYVVRLTAFILGSICLIGLSVFLRDQVGHITAAMSILILCVNPTFLDQTLFDNGNVALSMGLVGVAAFVGNRYLRSERLTWAFAFGLVVGISIWSRLNLLWIVGAMFLGSAFVFRLKLFMRPKAIAASVSGLLTGAAPLLFYLSRNFSALQDFMRRSETYHSRAEFFAYLIYRLRMLAEVFFSDAEHRAIWSNHPEPGTCVEASGCLALLGVIGCLLRRDSRSASTLWIRCFAISSLLLSFILLITREPVAEHHMVILLPFVIPCAVSFLGSMAKAGKFAAVFVYSVVLLYGASAIALQLRGAVKIHRNGGLGMWSDAIGLVYQSLEKEPAKSGVSVLDWGLAANIFFLSKTTLSPTEIFWGATAERSGRDLSWQDEIENGGVFVVTAPARRVFPIATAGFERAIRRVALPYTVQEIYQRDGVPFAFIYRIAAPRREGFETLDAPHPKQSSHLLKR